MPIDPDTEILRLRAAIRDLVAISAIPAAWVGRETQSIATGLADVLVGSLYLDFAFVRLCDPKGLTAVEVTRGNAWPEFPQYLQRRLAEGRRFSYREVVAEIGGDGQQSRGVIIPIGIHAEGGLVAAACHRTDFPGDIDQLLLSVAANHAATAFQNARLVEERCQAEKLLRQARDELEMKVTERTAELRRITAELETILGSSPFGTALFDGNQSVQRCNPAFERILGWKANEIVGRTMSIAPACRDHWSALLERLNRGDAFANVEIRLLRKDGSEFDAAIACAPFGDELGRPAGFVGTIEDISDRKRAEEALRRNEAYLAEAQRLSHTGSWVWDIGRRETIHWSHEQYRLFGFDPESGIPPFETWLQRVHQEDQGRVIQTIERAAEKTDIELDFRAVLPDGAVKYIRTVGRPTFNASGDLVSLVGTSIDVTERKHAEQERERLLAEAVAAQQRFRDLVNSIDGIVWEADAETFVFCFVSDQAERILGYPAEQWLHEPSFWEDHLHPEDRVWAVQFCVHATAEKRNHDFEYRMIASDGRVVWMRDLVTVLVENGRATRLRGVMFDITPRKEDEGALREQANLLNLTHDSIFVRDMKDVITYWNRGAEEFYGWSAEEAIGNVSHNLTKTVFPEPLPKIQADLLRNGRWEGELVHTKKDGTKVVVVSRWSLQPDERGAPIAILETNNDITERKRAEEERERLRQLEADLAHVSRVSLMGELAASLAHEIKQPITAAATNARTCLRWLQREPPEIEEARDTASRIVKDVTRAGDIINRVRSLYTRGPRQRELVDVNDVIHEMITLLRNEASRYSIFIRSDLAKDLPKVTVDRVQLQQVLMNLMLNGIEAMKDARPPNELTIRSRPEENGRLRVSISDTGVGLPGEGEDQIFKAFFTTKAQGTGMGLAISRSIIESHDGRLWASANTGRGATFQFTLSTHVTPSTSAERSASV